MEHWKNKSLVDIEGEIWMPVKNYEGSYSVSNMGRIKSISRRAKVQGGGSRAINEAIITRKPNPRGYIRVELSKVVNDRQQRRIYMLHRLVAEAFIENFDCKPTVNHLNTITWDNRVTNLEWATQSEQVQYAASHGNRPLGINAPQAKFTDEVIATVKKLGAEGVHYKTLAETFGMSLSYAHAISKGGRTRYDKHINKDVLAA